MILVLLMMATVWGIGALMATPLRLRLGTIAAIWAGVIVEHLVLPPGHPLREATGGSAQVWVVLGAAVALFGVYRAGIARLRARAGDRMAPAVPPPGAFRAAELDRYSRHILLREIGGPGQRRLREARVLVVGAGGLGAPVLMYLAAAGVGTLGVIDDDVVESSNLQRQVIHTDARLGQPKVASAAEAMRAINPFIAVRPYNRRLTDAIAAELFADYDLILDGSDSFDTRELVNRTAATLGKPLIAAAITQWEGQISLFDPARGGPCYLCIFPQRPAPGTVPTCAEAGVAAPLPGVLGTMMALEAVKLITGAGEGLMGRLMLYDGLSGETRMIRAASRPGCPVCAPLRARGWTAVRAQP